MTNALGRSAFNRVERRMAALSYHLAGLLLRHDSFRSHLDSTNKCIDEELEKKNFAEAGRTLANVWSELVIDKYPVHAEYIEPGEKAKLNNPVDPLWYVKHVRKSQYLFQVLKFI